MRPSAAALLLLGIASARAGDPPPPGGDSISAAKRDFSAIKSSSVAPDAPMPMLDMRDMGPAPGAPAAPTPLPTDKDPSLDPAKKASGTGNWLVDAMDKNPSRSQASRPGDERTKGDLGPANDTEKLDGERADAAGSREGPSGAGARDAGGPKEPAERVYNPLDSFMGSWISARDHELLAPASKGEAPGGAEPAPHSDVPGGPDIVPSGSLVDMLLAPPAAASWMDAKPEANPFVASSDSEPAAAVRFFSGADAAGFSAFGPADAVPGAGLSGRVSQPADNSRTFLPDFAQPSDDDKYFKQMKRF